MTPGVGGTGTEGFGTSKAFFEDNNGVGTEGIVGGIGLPGLTEGVLGD